MRNGYSGQTCRGQSLTSAVDPQLHSRQNARIAFTGLLIIFTSSSAAFHSPTNSSASLLTDAEVNITLFISRSFQSIVFCFLCQILSALTMASRRAILTAFATKYRHNSYPPAGAYRSICGCDLQSCSIRTPKFSRQR